MGERVESGEWRGPQDIDALVGELFAEPHASVANPVQIMTIHRAKGLEFDHVFLPGLDRQLNRGARALAALARPAARDGVRATCSWRPCRP